MMVPLNQYGEEELKQILHKIARICLSDEFNDLRRELESLYRQDQNENAFVNAFQDALYTLLVRMKK